MVYTSLLRRRTLTSKQLFSAFLGLLFCTIFSHSAFAAGDDMSQIAQNISASTTQLPAVIAGFAYLSGLLMGITAVFKTVDHVSNPVQTPIRVPIIRFIIGGALFSLPIITEAVITTINGGTTGGFEYNAGIVGSISGLFGIVGYVPGVGGNFNSILSSIIFSTTRVPALIATVAYLLGMLITVSALYKTRDHVEDPDRVPLKDAVIRYITAGALLALPTTFDAMYNTINGSGMGTFGTIATILGGAGWFNSTQVGTIFTGFSGCTGVVAITADLGAVICKTLASSMALPGFLTAVAYFIGLVLGVWAILKIRDHVNNPSQTALSEGISRLVAAGAFFALPVVTMAMAYSITPNTVALQAIDQANTGFTGPAPTCGTANSLDQAMVCFMDDILGPSHVLLNFFCFCAGTIFIMIGISRLTKSAQEGARGPGGIGTLSTFIIGGLLMSATTILRAISSSLFTGVGISGRTATTANLAYTGTMSAAETAAAYNVINAVLKFMIVIGMISFVRGLFIMRDVSEGSQGASTMAGMTHIIGGALAVNLGPLLNAVQTTLGITAFGVTFS